MWNACLEANQGFHAERSWGLIFSQIPDCTTLGCWNHRRLSQIRGLKSMLSFVSEWWSMVKSILMCCRIQICREHNANFLTQLFPITSCVFLPKLNSSNRLAQWTIISLNLFKNLFFKCTLVASDFCLTDWLGSAQVKSSRMKNVAKVLYLASFVESRSLRGNNLLEHNVSHLRNASGTER